MIYRALFPIALLLAACSSEVAPNPLTEAAELAPLTFMAPESSDADYDSAVAPYVLARGAGPSALSPDGTTIATRLSLTGDRQLYVMDATADDPKATLNQLTFGSGITFFEFSPTGDLVYGSDNNGDERENYWLVSKVDGAWGEPRLILPATEQGFRQFGDFTGDGRTIVYSSTERNGLDFDVYKADIVTGVAALVYEGVLGNYVQAVAPDGSTAIISEAVGEDSDKLFVLDLITGVRTLLSDPTPRANHTDAGVEYLSADTVLLATNRGGEFAALTQFDLNENPSAIPFVPALDMDVDGFSVCGGSTIFTVNQDGFSQTRVIRPNDENVVIDGLPVGVHSVDCAGSQALVRVSASNLPGDLYLVDLDALEPRRVFTSDYEGLDPASLILPEAIRLPARDGVEVQGLLYLPTNTTAKPPAVFMVHGGPTAQSRPSYNASAQYLLSRGIAVFQPNVRGSTGFGRTYVTLDDKRKRLDSVRDLVDMLAYLETDGRVDTSRAAVMGGSYGGYMVNAVLADYPDAFDAGVALFGVGDWVTALEVASPGLKASDIIEYGDITDPVWREFYTEISPIAKAGNIRVPVLYSHGAMDPRIDVYETEVMVRALRENSIRADYVLIPDEGHGWRKLANRLYYERVQADFLEEVLGE
ncbi:MAG: S9 family peptidase [Litorimonas sp.]